MKSSGALWHAQLCETLHGMDFRPTLADPDMWIKPACKPDGSEYYQYILVDVDDLLVLSHAPKEIMNTIQKAYRLKDTPAEPITHLGATIKQWTVPHEPRTVWSMNSQQYAFHCLELELSNWDLPYVEN